MRGRGAGARLTVRSRCVKSAKTRDDVGDAASSERAPAIAASSLRHAHTWERSRRVIWSIAVRARWVVSTRVEISPERRMTKSISENVASDTISAMIT